MSGVPSPGVFGIVRAALARFLGFLDLGVLTMGAVTVVSSEDSLLVSSLSFVLLSSFSANWLSFDGVSCSFGAMSDEVGKVEIWAIDSSSPLSSAEVGAVAEIFRLRAISSNSIKWADSEGTLSLIISAELFCGYKKELKSRA